jgi:hypothetical protein
MVDTREDVVRGGKCGGKLFSHPGLLRPLPGE